MNKSCYRHLKQSYNITNGGTINRWHSLTQLFGSNSKEIRFRVKKQSCPCSCHEAWEVRWDVAPHLFVKTTIHTPHPLNNADLQIHTRIVLTSASSNTVGTMLNTIADSTKLIPRLPLSIVCKHYKISVIQKKLFRNK